MRSPSVETERDCLQSRAPLDFKAFQGSANLHPLIAFIVALGGLAAMGFPGIFVGPIVGDGLVIFAGTYDDHGPNYARARAYELPATVGDKLDLKLLWEKPYEGG